MKRRTAIVGLAAALLRPRQSSACRDFTTFSQAIHGSTAIVIANVEETVPFGGAMGGSTWIASAVVEELVFGEMPDRFSFPVWERNPDRVRCGQAFTNVPQDRSGVPYRAALCFGPYGHQPPNEFPIPWRYSLRSRYLIEERFGYLLHEPYLRGPYFNGALRDFIPMAFRAAALPPRVVQL